MKRKHRIKIKRKADITLFVCTCGEPALPLPGKKFTFACPIGHANLFEKRKTMTEKKYPEEIYMAGDEFSNFLVGKGSPIGDMAEKAYDLGFDTGFESGKHYALAGTGDWHNLTEAIKAGEPIDFEKLDGRIVNCVNSDESISIIHNIERDESYASFAPNGWCRVSALPSWKFALVKSWHGKDGWNLWLDGEIPMRKQTANELSFGTEFFSNFGKKYVVVAAGRVQDVISGKVSIAKHIEVAEVLGMYGQKESE